MTWKYFLSSVFFGAVLIGVSAPVFGQGATLNASPQERSAWRAATESSAGANESSAGLASPNALADKLPGRAGQIWREYDISPYTSRITSTKRPELTIVDWIMRETGYEAWHTDPLGVLAADGRTIRVYHTAEMHKVVADIVDRFTNNEAAAYTFSMRVITLDSPNWRAGVQQLLTAVPVRSSGSSAWVLAKEDAAILLGQLRRRNDYSEHSSPRLVVNNGQSTVVSSIRGRPYVRDVVFRSDTAAGFEPATAQIDEGFFIEFSPLLTSDRRLIDAFIKCDIDQVEKMAPVTIDTPAASLPRQRAKIEVPQIVHYGYQERFRWPVDQVLIVSLGMVPLPIPINGAPLVRGVPLPLGNSPARAELLIFLECKGSLDGADPLATGQLREAKNYRGRY